MATSNCGVAVYINPDSGRFRTLEMQLQLFVSGCRHSLKHACVLDDPHQASFTTFCFLKRREKLIFDL
jgi:hypothetical protein